MTELVQIIVVCVGLLAVAALLVWTLTQIVEARTTRAIRRAAEELGLAPDPKASVALGERGEVQRDPVYSGTVDGVAIRLGPGWRIVTVYKYVTAVSRVVIVGTLPRPIGFQIEMVNSGLATRSLRLGDRPFDRHVVVTTDAPRAARALLASPELRERIRRFLRRGAGGLASVAGEEIVKQVFDAHTRGAKSLVGSIREIVEISTGLVRAEEARLERQERELDTDTLIRLLKGEHLPVPERIRRGMWTHPPLHFSDLVYHLKQLVERDTYFPRAWQPHQPGEAVDERGTIERQSARRYIYRARRHLAVNPTVLAEETERRFWSAETAVRFYLKWDLGLPDRGELDGFRVIGE